MSAAKTSQRERVQKPIRYPSKPIFHSADEEVAFRKGRAAAACRVMVDEGFEHCSVVVSIRDALDPTRIWISPRHRALGLVKQSELLPVKLVEDAHETEGVDPSALANHLSIYSARPDVNAVIQGATPFARAFSTHGRPIGMFCQDACIFYRQVSVMSSSTDSHSVSAALGLGKALLVTNWGQMVASVSIESAVSYFIRIENLCKAQVYAEAAARGRGEKPVTIGDEECRFTWEKTGDEAHGSALALPYFARVERQSAGSHLQ